VKTFSSVDAFYRDHRPPIDVRAQLSVVEPGATRRAKWRPNHNFGAPEGRVFYIGQIDLGENPISFGESREVLIRIIDGPGLREHLQRARIWRIQEGVHLIATGSRDHAAKSDKFSIATMKTPRMRFLSESDWTLAPGPHNPPPSFKTYDLQEDVQRYPVGAIATTFLDFPHMQLLTPSETSWWKWRARWESEQDYIEIGMTLFSDESPYWGGSSISADCGVEAIEALWSHVQARHPIIWLVDNNECQMYSRKTFLDLYESNRSSPC
jgi:hypothetical protein